MFRTELVVDRGTTILPGHTNDSVALIGRGALDAVFVALNRQPLRWLTLFFDDEKVFLSIDGEKVTRVGEFDGEFVKRVLRGIARGHIMGMERDMQLHVSIDV